MIRTNRLRRHSALAVGVALLVVLLLAARTFGHGGGQLYIARETAGPYLMSVWVNPPQPRSSEPTHFTVGLADAVDESPVLDAAVMVTMSAVGEGTAVVQAPATTDQSINKLFYEADLDVNQVGLYEANVVVQGSEGAGEVTFALEVERGSPINWLWVGMGAFGLILVWIVWRSRRTSAAPPRKRRRRG